MLITPQALWQNAKAHLRLLMPEATYDSLFADSEGQPGENGSLVVAVSSAQTKAWIEARLAGAVGQALGTAGYQGPVTFRARPAAPPTPALPTPGPERLKPGDVALTFLNFNLYARGWLRTPTYYELYWQPVMGCVAYATWRLMQVLYWNSPSPAVTRRVRLDIQDTAAHLGVSRDLVRGKPAQGMGGALATLADLGLAQVTRHAAGRATVYGGRFRRQLPLLAPAQAAGLTQSQQQAHLEWLLAAGIDLTEWEALGERYPSFVLDEGEAPAELEPYASPAWEADQLAQLGFLRTPAYYDLFLQPLIGPEAYAVWRVCKCLNWSGSGQTYTQDTVTSVYALAATLACHRQKITGARRRRDGRASWQQGAFDRLRQQRLALIREQGKGSAVAYRLLVVNEPPLLCPNQVEQFPAKLQAAHSDWLNKAQLELDEWQQLPMDSLLTLLDACAEAETTDAGRHTAD